MKRYLIVLFILLAPLAFAGTVQWTLPTSYTDNTAIDASDRATLLTDVYVGATTGGPWTFIGTSSPGGSSLTAATSRNRYFSAVSYWDNTDRSDYASPFFYPRGRPKAPVAVSVP